MATADELLRAAEHMRQQGDAAFADGSRDGVVRGVNYSHAADRLEEEAARLRLTASDHQPRNKDGWQTARGDCLRVEALSETTVGVRVCPKDGPTTWLYLSMDEARRLGQEVMDAAKPARSWPEGWPPFAVLRRAYEALGMVPTPSVKTLERRHGSPTWARTKWNRSLSQVLSEMNPSTT